MHMALDDMGSFEATIEVNSSHEYFIFYVIARGTRNLLGRDKAIPLGVLNIGIGINQIEHNPFSKFKNILVEIPIDESMKAVSQPYR